MQKKHSRILFLCVGTALACLGSARYIAVRLSNLQLMHLAVFALTVDEQANVCSSHCWLSEQDLLLFRAVPTGRYELVRHHLPDGKEYPLNGLTRLFNVTHSYPNYSRLSPDGKWLAWQGSDYSAHHGLSSAILCFAHIDGSHYVQQRYDGGIPYWAADSRHWLASNSGGFPFLESSRSFLLGNVETPSIRQTVKVPTGGDVDTGLFGSSNPLMEEIDPVWIWEPHAIQVHKSMMFMWNLPAKCDVLLEFKAIGDLIPTAKHTIRLPYPGSIKKVVLAPGGKRLAWEIMYTQPPFLSGLMKWLPFKPKGMDEGRNMLAIWEGSADSSDVHEVGEMEIGNVPIGNAEPTNLQWLPDGNSLSFEFKKGLYVIRLPRR